MNSPSHQRPSMNGDLPSSPSNGRSRRHTGLRVPLPLSPSDDGTSLYHRMGLVDDSGGKYEHFRKSDDEIASCKSKKVRQFYEQQNEILDMFREVDQLLDEPATIEHSEAMNIVEETTALLPKYTSKTGKDASEKSTVKWAININIVINAILLIGKLVVALASNSVSLIASTIDSAMDFLSTLLLFGASQAIENKRFIKKFPVGVRRAEPMSVVVFSVIMIASFIQVGVESCSRLAQHDLEVVELPLMGIIIMLVTIVVKLIIWWTYRLSKSSSVQALAQDAENDVIFNIFSLTFPWAGHLLGVPWLDPLGGLLLSIYIVVEWVHTLRSNISRLMGARSGPDDHQRVAYLISRFSPSVIAIQHIEVYSCGDQKIVEADIILPVDISLPKAHDIGENVQYALESLSGIERAYCHVDYNPYNPYGHVVR